MPAGRLCGPNLEASLAAALGRPAPSFKAALSTGLRLQILFPPRSSSQVDEIFKAAAQAANMARIPLAKMTVAETGMGVVEDKVRKKWFIVCWWAHMLSLQAT